MLVRVLVFLCDGTSACEDSGRYIIPNFGMAATDEK
jgi:hypothetical protein